MTYSDFTSYVRWLTRTNSATFTDTNLVVVANSIIEEFAQEITKVNEDYFGMVFYRDLVAGQRDYTFPSELCDNMKRLEICIAGDTNSDGNLKYKVAEEFDLNLYQHSTDEATITSQFNGKSPAFEIYGGSIWIYSGETMIDVSSGLKLWAIMYPQKIETTDLSTDMQIDVPKVSTAFGLKRQFHKLLAIKVAIEWKQSREKPIPLRGDELLFESNFKKALDSARGMNLDRAFTATVPYNNGTQY